MATILVTPQRDGNIVVEVRRALKNLSCGASPLRDWYRPRPDGGLIRVADDVESEALAILNDVHIAVLREAGRTRRKSRALS
jgi:hypothetical protein